MYKKFLSAMLLLLLFTAGCAHTKSPAEFPASSGTTDPNTTAEMPVSSENTKHPDTAEKSLYVKTSGIIFSLQLYDNAAAEAFEELLPLTLTMNELNGNEKFFYFSSEFPITPSNSTALHTGDLMLYGSNCLVLFYQSFSISYSYTPLGRIKDATLLPQALGSKEAIVHFYFT